MTLRGDKRWSYRSWRSEAIVDVEVEDKTETETRKTRDKRDERQREEKRDETGETRDKRRDKQTQIWAVIIDCFHWGLSTDPYIHFWSTLFSNILEESKLFYSILFCSWGFYSVLGACDILVASMEPCDKFWSHLCHIWVFCHLCDLLWRLCDILVMCCDKWQE
jgi:hypothetical protein